MMGLPIEVVNTFVCDGLGRKLSNIVVVDPINIVPPRKQLNSAFCLRGVIEEYVRMGLQDNTICIMLMVANVEYG